MGKIRLGAVRLAVALALGGVLLAPAPARAATQWHYIFTWDGLNSTYPQNSLAFVSPILLRHLGDDIYGISGNINGFAPLGMGVAATAGDFAIGFGSLPAATSTSPEGLSELAWYASEAVDGPGLYTTTNGAGRGFSVPTGFGTMGLTYIYTSGTLLVVAETIPDIGGGGGGPGPTDVAEPASLALLGGGLAMVGGLIRRRRSGTQG